MKNFRNSGAGRPGSMHTLPVLPLLAIALGGCATNPATGGRMLSLVSEGQEIRMGQEGAAAVESSIGLYPDDDLQSYVDSIGQLLAAASERPGLPWRFRVIEQPVVNAFALPGGFIYVARGIMTHFNSEAELASVLGHEIGHVTARHSVEQISRAQLAGIGLLAGAVFAPEAVSQFGGALNTSLGLLFLKYGRDDESQADLLGHRYMTRLAYDPMGAVDMFEILARQRSSSGGSSVPEWASTHPDPGNRLQAARARAAAAPGGLVRREEYLRRLDGVVFGENPRAGYFQNGNFLHPDLEFRIDFPGGWTTQNSAQSVLAVSPGKDAVIQLTLAEEQSAAAAASSFFAQQGLSGRPASRTLNGLRASSGEFRAQTRDGVLRGHVTFVEYGENTYSLLAYTPEARFRSYDNTLQSTLSSFRRLTNSAALNVQPKRVKVVRTDRRMTITEFQRRFPSTISLDRLAVMNGVDVGESIPAGTTMKRVVGRGAPQ
ncbi:MAG: M48 family metalloprotease [Gemmatimonadota bacterium]